MKRGILIAFAFGLLGAAVVMVYSMTTWQQPLTPLLYALLGVVPLSLGGSLAIIFDEIDRQAWWKDTKVFACLFASLIASLSLPAAWAAPKVRANMLHQFASPELAMSALALDRDHNIRLGACNMLIGQESRQISTELTSRLANSPRLGIDCIEGSRDQKQTKDIARRVALRWHAGLVGLDSLAEDHTKLLVDGLKTLPLLPQQQVTTLFDCAVRGASPTATTVSGRTAASRCPMPPGPGRRRRGWPSTPSTPPRLCAARSYATSCVAALCHEILAAGKRFCTLFADVENPTVQRHLPAPMLRAPG